MANAARVTWLSDRLGGAVILFVAACFLLPTGPAYALVFYIAVLPCLAARLARRRTVPKSWAFWAGVALIVWSGLTLLWGRDDGARAWPMAAGAVCTLAFWFAVSLGLDQAPGRTRLARVLVGSGAANALAGVARYVLAPDDVLPGQVRRLHGWGITYHPVLGAVVFAVCLLTALDLARHDRRNRVWHLAAATVIGVAVLLTESRGPALALAAGALVLLVRGRPIGRVAPALLAVLPLGWFAWRMGLIRTGDSGHVDVWRLTWAQIQGRPWLGYGLAADLLPALGADKRFPHNLYLSVLFYSGAIGLVLFAAWAALLTIRLKRARLGPDGAWLAALWVNALIAGMTDFGQITKGPAPLWIILWLPAGLISKQEGSISFLKKRNKKPLLFRGTQR